ncbi:3-oxoacyl-ACP synthase III [Candidatus Woesearchaeota archaeon]|nr:3-oxoacyl-ACP synthase III [Candidatus Woesearchaeota archaeon]
MRYSKVYLESMGYELAPVVVTSQEIEQRLAPLYEKINISQGQLETWTGISERRWWEPGYPLSQGAIAAARKALASSNVKPKDIDILIYASVGREAHEPATACKVADALGISKDAFIYDLSNACLAAINGIVDIANHIELGNCRAGMVVSCESAREINEITIKRMLENGTMEYLIKSMTTLTGGSGASAILLTDGSFSNSAKHKLIGGVSCTAPEFHDLCQWGMEPLGDGHFKEVMRTDAIGVLKNGVKLGKRTWNNFLDTVGWKKDDVDKTICHQVAEKNQEIMLKTMGIPREKDFITYPFLGNMGTVALPTTAAIADERGFLQRGDNVFFGGIGSGLNCMMLGWKW